MRGLTADDLKPEEWFIRAEDREHAERRAQKKINDIRRDVDDHLPEGEWVFKGKWMEGIDESTFPGHEGNPTWKFHFYPEGAPDEGGE